MSITPQQQAIQQITNIQHQVHGYTQGAAAAGNPMGHMIDHQIQTVKNDIAANKNPITVKKDMETLNRMLQTDQRQRYQPTTNAQQSGHYGSPAHGQTGGHFSGPVLGSHSVSNQVNFGLKQLNNTLSQIRPHF